MLITLTRTGGFTGIPLKKTIDTTKLPVEEANKIEELIKNNQINEYTNKQINQNPSPDRFTYTLSIQDEENFQEAHFSEEQMPKGIKTLIEKVQNS